MMARTIGDSIKTILRKTKRYIKMDQTDPMIQSKKRKEWITRLAYRYFTIEQAAEFDKLFNSKYVKDNRKVKNVVRLLTTKYMKERELWLARRNQRRY